MVLSFFFLDKALSCRPKTEKMSKKRPRSAPAQPETPPKPRRGGQKKRKRHAEARTRRVSREKTQLELALAACAPRPPRRTGMVRRPRVTYREVAQELWGVEVAKNAEKIRRLMKKHGLYIPEIARKPLLGH